MKRISPSFCAGAIFIAALLLSPLAQAASNTGGTQAANSTAPTQAQTNPYSPSYGHPYRHGVIPTRETLAKMKLWQSLHASTSTTTATTATGPNTLYYQGGNNSASQGNVGVMNGVVKVYLVFWGSGWGTQSTDSNGDAVFSGDPDGAAPVAQEMFKDIGTGGETWSAELTQWCQGIASNSISCPSSTPASAFIPYQKGGILAGVWEDTSATSPINATAKQLGQEAVAAAQHFGNTTPASNRYAYYVIISATGDNPDNYQGYYCAWHDWNGDVGASSSVGDIAFSNQPYNMDQGSNCGVGFVNSPGTLDGWTMTLGHEWQETMSDAFPSGGWIAINNSYYENSDECAWLSSGQGASANVTLGTGTFTEQSSWSNDTNRCDLTHTMLSHATDGLVITPLNVSVNDKLSAADSDGDTLSYAIVANASHGSASITDPTTGAFSYTPAFGYVGSDSFTFDVIDSAGDTSNTATESVTITGNATPTASNGAINTVTNVTAGGTLSASDTDGDMLTFAIVTNPSHGLLTVTNASTGDFTYAPVSGYAGNDSFTFKATDSSLLVSNTATESVVVNDNPPTANNGSVSTLIDTPYSGALSATDLDSGQTLIYAIVAQPAHGTVTLTNAATGAFTYAPAAGYLGSDTFSFKVNDGYMDSGTATESVSVYDNAPLAGDSSVSTPASTAYSGALSASDADSGQTLSYSIVAQPSHGTISITNPATGTFTYTPVSGYVGSDSLTFNVSDSYLYSNTATVSVNVIDTAPVATGASHTIKANGTASAQLTASDADAGQSLTYTIVTQPSHGAVTISDASTGAFTYTPSLGYSGSDSFTFKANDGYLDSNTATESITITDQAPVASGTNISVKTNGTVTEQLDASDADAGQKLTYAIVQQPAHGAVSLVASTGEVTYFPTHGYSGSDSFSFQANDGYKNSNTASVAVTVQSSGGGAFGPWSLGFLGLLAGLMVRRRSRRGAVE